MRRILSIIFLLSLAASCTHEKKADVSLKVAVVQVPKLYSEFQYHKEIKKEMQQKAERLNSQKDSIKFLYVTFKEKLNQKEAVSLDDEKRLESLRITYNDLLNQVQQKLQKESEEYDHQIASQLNDYIKAFAEEKGYDIVYGHYESNILYAKDHYDVTDQLIEYVNHKYQND